MAEKKAPEVDQLASPGFRLLKPGKELVIAGRRFIRSKDVEINTGTKKHVEKNIKKISYVPHSLIKSSGANLKHFESEVFTKIPDIKKVTVKEAVTAINKKLA